MPIIEPFRGIFYNPEKINSLAEVVAPPYDVIDDQMGKTLLTRNPYNIVRLILGKSAQKKGQPRAMEAYHQAAKNLTTWCQKQILINDKQPAIYFLEEEFTILGHKYCRKGFIGLLRLDNLKNNAILPHEQTMDGPKEDRLKLMRICRANFSQIFTLYDDPELLVEKTLQQNCLEENPFLEINGTDSLDKVHRRLWRVTDTEAIQKVRTFLAPQSLLIADGHHRFETAIKYRQLKRQEEPGTAPGQPYDYVMVYGTNTASPGLAILPTHRLLSGYPTMNRETFRQQAGKYFHLTVLEPPTTSNEETVKWLLDRLNQAQKDIHFIAIVGPQPDYLLLSQTKEKIATMMANLPPSLASMDVTALQHLLFEQALDINPTDMKNQRYISFTQDAVVALKTVKAGENQLAILLRPTSITQIKKVTATGEKMPQKSTFFYPKLVSGLILYLFDPC